MKARHEIQYLLHYSSALERMNASFYRHLDNSIFIFQYILAAFIIAEYGNGFCTGLALAGLTALSFTVRPSEKALLSEQQHKRYAQLSTNEPDNDSDVLQAFNDIQLSDNACLAMLHQAAHIRAGLILGSDMKDQTLSLSEWLVARFSGEYLKRSKN